VLRQVRLHSRRLRHRPLHSPPLCRQNNTESNQLHSKHLAFGIWHLAFSKYLVK
jgi:hypothetical protein